MKTVLYCRVDGPQTSFALDAIKGQQLYLMDYAKKNNIEIAGIYLDVGYHGRTMDRPGLQSVIQTLKEGNADGFWLQIITAYIAGVSHRNCRSSRLFH